MYGGQVLEDIQKLHMYPEISRNQFATTVGGRLEWCISRQRVWGVPIPALICGSCDYAFTSQSFIDHVAEHVNSQGIEYWDEVLVAAIIPHDLCCPLCSSSHWRKETDILDVWFDAGVSHYAVLKYNKQLAFPADLYAEGKDQHRGWFQSSLLTSVALYNQAPMTAILTHGFTVDAKGRKMSKSVGNVVAPQDIITSARY